jgi:S-formylglutathione hydrolase
MESSKRKSYCIQLAIIVGLCITALPQTQTPRSHGTIEHIEIEAKSLAGNQLGDPTTQKCLVYLPSGYAEHPDLRYPVLYLLHGFSLGSVLEDWGSVAAEAMDSFVTANPSKAFIVVIPNGANAVHGSYYVNSSVGGNWEDYIIDDLVRSIDTRYRTIPVKGSRAIAGHSMGGFAALRLAMLHSDLYNTAYAMSPCCLDLQDDFTSTNPEWKKVVALKSVADIQAAATQNNFWATALAAFAIAASPNPKAPMEADLPYRESGGKLVPVLPVVSRWKRVMPLDMIRDHQADLKALSGVAIDYGYEDDFSHIPDTSRQFAERLLALHIPVVVEGYHGDHNNQVPARVGTRMIPYIAAHLVFSEVNLGPRR